jgi:hypothetical protein
MTTELSERERKRRQRQREAAELKTWLSFQDLKLLGIVDNWQTLKNWQSDPAIKFPVGKLLGPNTRRWDKQTEIDPWLASRPIEREVA